MSNIQCFKICKRFVESKNHGAEITVLENLNLSIPSGQFVSVVGPNGCGKTTLLNIIAGIWKADSGKVVVEPTTGYIAKGITRREFFTGKRGGTNDKRSDHK